MTNLKSYDSVFQTAKMSNEKMDLDEIENQQYFAKKHHFLSSATNNLQSQLNTTQQSKMYKTGSKNENI